MLLKENPNQDQMITNGGGAYAMILLMKLRIGSSYLV
jgi:hypothetical protein